MFIGYRRISTDHQNLILQDDALKKAGCERIFEDIASGSIDDRPGLREALEFLKTGDVLVVWKLDRLGRSLRHLIEVINGLSRNGIGFRSLTESIDTITPQGRLTLHIFGALSEFERELIRSRSIAGLEAARARGRIGGRKEKLTPEQIEIARQLFSERNYSVKQVAKSLGVSRATLYRKFKR